MHRDPIANFAARARKNSCDPFEAYALRDGSVTRKHVNGADAARKVGHRSMLFGRKKRRISRLLIVEDEPLVAFDTEHFLREAEYEIVATVDRVADALAVLRRPGDVDLVLVDVRLSDGSGIDVARAAHAAGVPALFVTGQSPDGGHAVAAGCLAKPYSQRDLIAAIGVIEAVTEGKEPKRVPPGLTLFGAA